MRVTNCGWLVCAGLIAAMMVGCGEAGSKNSGATVKLQGAGASFPAPLYNKWFKEFGASHSGMQVDYQSVGSGAGVKAIIDKTVDFGASDAAMTPEEMGKVDVGVQLFPMTAGSIVLAYNLPGIEELKLSRDAYAGIFLGKITKWNDAAITSTNPGAKLPDSPINVVTRSDGSGTSFVFSQHLSAISKDFDSKVGKHKMPSWPVGTGAKGNEGVTGAIKTTPGSIGYVEYGYAANLGLPMASLENKAGKFIAPSIKSGQASLAAVELPEDLIAWLPDPQGDESYPIVTYTWLLCYKKYSDPAKAKALAELIAYCMDDGQKTSEKLGYIPLPEPVIAKVKGALKNIQ